METGSTTCGDCKLQSVCNTNLKPETLKAPLDNKHIPLDEWQHHTFCRHLTCGNEGVPAAKDALKRKSLKKYRVFNGVEVQAVPFGSVAKQTEIGELRIVTERGLIFSKQGSVYYPTGQVIRI